MNVTLSLRRGVSSALAVALALGVDPIAHLDLSRPLQGADNVILALGTEHDVVIPPLPLDYTAAGRLFGSPAQFSAVVGTYGYSAVARLTTTAATLRGSAGYLAPRIYAAGRLAGVPATFRGLAEVPSSFLVSSSASAWAALPERNGTVGYTFPWRPTAGTLDLFLGVPWGPAMHADVSYRVAWEAGVPLDRFIGEPWGAFTDLNTSLLLPWSYPPTNDHAWVVPFNTSMPSKDISVLMSYLLPPAKDRAWLSPWANLSSYLLDRSATVNYLYPPKKDRTNYEISWGLGQPPDYSVHYPLPPVNEPLPVVNRSGYVCFNLHRPLTLDAANVPLNLRRPLRTYCDTGSFIINNHLSVITLLDGLPLEVIAVTMSTDISSFAWNLKLTLPTYDEYTRVRPSPAEDGAREIQITLNGYVWRGFIDTVSRNRQFVNDTYTAEGKSFTAYGAQPFAPLASFISTSDELTQQLANDLFQYLGFDITWDAVDWVVPAGLFAYSDKDPMGALSQICEAGGYFILPGRYDKSMVVRSRYPVTIWHWDDPATPVDAHIPLNQMISGASRFQAGIDINRVFVSGTQTGNTIAATRDGTAGDVLAPNVVNTMLATDEAASERARVELCKGGARIFNTYVTPIVSATDPGVRLRSVGELVAVDEDTLDDLAYNGLITSLSVAAVRTGAGQLTAYQTLEVERHV